MYGRLRSPLAEPNLKKLSLPDRKIQLGARLMRTWPGVFTRHSQVEMLASGRTNPNGLDTGCTYGVVLLLCMYVVLRTDGLGSPVQSISLQNVKPEDQWSVAIASLGFWS